MKKLLLIVAFIGLAATAQAQEVCLKLSEFAGSVMGARQRGALLSDALRVVPAGETKALLDYVVVEAYKRPHWRSDAQQHREVADFSNDILLECLEVIR
jgi:hypothetical protein